MKAFSGKNQPHRSLRMVPLNLKKSGGSRLGFGLLGSAPVAHGLKMGVVKVVTHFTISGKKEKDHKVR